MQIQIAHSQATRQRVIASFTAMAMLLLPLLSGKVEAASAWNPTLLVNTESFQVIDEGDGTSSIEIRFGGTLNEKILYDRTNNRFTFSRSVKIAGTLTTTGSAIINVGNAAATADTGLALEVIGTASGRVLHAQSALTSSGSLRIAGAFTGATTMYGAGLGDCDDGTNSKLLWDSTTGRFSCGTDQTGAGSLTQTSADTRYVNAEGDTMTGALRIANSAGLNASGSILTNTNITINSDNGAADAVLTFGNATAAQTITFANATQRFNFTKEVHTDSNLTASGTITVDGAAKFKSTINLNNIAYTFPGAQGSSGNVLRTNGNGTLSWGSVASGSGDILTLNPEYANAVYFSSGSVNVGTMTYSYDATNLENFYRWTTTKATLQDYWVSTRVQLPKNFTHFDTASGIVLRLRTTATSAASNYLTVRLLDSNGNAVAIGNNAQIASAAAATWKTHTITGVTNGTYTAGGYITVLIKTAGTTGNNTDLGYLKFNWSTMP